MDPKTERQPEIKRALMILDECLSELGMNIATLDDKLAPILSKAPQGEPSNPKEVASSYQTDLGNAIGGKASSVTTLIGVIKRINRSLEI